MWVFSKNKYNASLEAVDKKDKLSFFYEISLFIIDVLHLEKLEKRNKTQTSLVHLRIDKKLYLCKKVSMAVFVILMFNCLSLLGSINDLDKPLLQKGGYINRPSHGEGEKEVNLGVKIHGDKKIDTQISFGVGEEQYTEKEIEKVMEDGKKYIDHAILGNNTSKDKITEPLNLMREIPNTGVNITWKMDKKDLIDRNGRLDNLLVPSEGEIVEITAILNYQTKIIEYTIFLKVMPAVLSWKEQEINELKEKLNQANQENITEDRFVLPKEMQGKDIFFYEIKSHTGIYILFVGVALAIIFYLAMDQEVNRKMRKRDIELLVDYPEIVNKFTLLLGAGLTTKKAWGKIVEDYYKKIHEGGGKERMAYEEMLSTWREISNGITEIVAFQNFGRRIHLLPYLKFSSLISQNIKKGSEGLLELLEVEGIEAYEERKEFARRQGEEAGTKLLGPMMLMLLIVFLIIMIPAFMSLN